MTFDLFSIFNFSFFGCIALIVFCALCALVFSGTKLAPNHQLDITSVEPHATIIDDTRSWATLQPTGREIFFPKVHVDRAVYELTLTGTLQGEHGRADAFYRTDHDGNFTRGMNWLQICRQELQYVDWEFIEEERREHRYKIRFAYAGRLTLALRNTESGWCPTTWYGGLIAELCVLPTDTITNKQRAEIERQRVEKERVAAQAKAATAAEAARFAQMVQALSIRAELNRNWRDPQYREKFARAHTEEMINKQAEIRIDAQEILEQPKLVSYLHRHAPAVVPTLLGRLECLLLAEQMAVDRVLAVADAAATPRLMELTRPKRKLTPEEVRKLKLNRQRIQDQDRIALKMDRLETQLMIRDRLEGMELDPDEREMVEEELMKQIEEGDDDGTTKTI